MSDTQKESRLDRVEGCVDLQKMCSWKGPRFVRELQNQRADMNNIGHLKIFTGPFTPLISAF